MSNTFKILIGMGLIGMVALIYGIYSHSQGVAKNDVDKVKFKIEYNQFDKEFSDNWNKEKAKRNPEDKEAWDKKNAADQVKYEEKNMKLEAELKEKEAVLSKKTELANNVEKGINDALNDPDIDFSTAERKKFDAEFEKMMQE